jgi:hypothetical protein
MRIHKDIKCATTTTTTESRWCIRPMDLVQLLNLLFLLLLLLVMASPSRLTRQVDDFFRRR